MLNWQRAGSLAGFERRNKGRFLLLAPTDRQTARAGWDGWEGDELPPNSFWNRASEPAGLGLRPLAPGNGGTSQGCHSVGRGRGSPIGYAKIPETLGQRRHAMHR